MKGLLLFIGIVLLIAVSIVHVYKTAELKILEKTRAAFEYREHQLEALLTYAEEEERETIAAKIDEIKEEEKIIDEEKQIVNDQIFV